MTDQLSILNFIGGSLIEPSDGLYLDVIEPATSSAYARVAASTSQDVNAAVNAAKSAFPAWSRSPASQRADILNTVADALEEKLDLFAQAESRDTGKPIALAKTVDIPRAVANFRFFASAILHTQSEMHDMGATGFNYTLRQPRGVAGCISPWNLPLYLLSWKIAPALATGNTVVAKPSELTPMTAHMLAEVWKEVDAPAGVMNIVHGTGESAGAAVVEHPDVPTITFTGSTHVGKWIASTCGRSLKRCSLELGGKNPFLVFADANQEFASATALNAAFTNQGQVCTCGSRILVEQSAYDHFLERLVAGAQARRIGDPLDPATEHGCQISTGQLEKIERAVQIARDAGATVHCGGRRVPPNRLPARCKDGFFYEPTVLTDIPNTCEVVQEEIFGPVVTVQPFVDENEALTLANSTNYGLAASVFTNSLQRAHSVSAAINAGMVWVNCWMLRDLRTPFGGAKQSGMGREGGNDALRFFTEAKNICFAGSSRL